MFDSKRRLLFLAALFAGCTSAPLPDPSSEPEEGPPLVSADGKTDGLGNEIAAYAELPEAAVLDREFEVLFAPDDPVNTIERELIDQVVREREADDREFAEGENPYRIRYAVYNVRNPLIVDGLADAADAGVDVQVLMEADQLDPARDWNTADERLIERGFEFEPDHRQMTGDAAATADLVGITGSGLMHLKARIFETPMQRVVLSGSLNPGDNAVLNEETLHLIRDPDVVSRYVGAYEAVLFDADFENVWDEDAAVNVLFTPARDERAAGHVLDWVAEEEEQILLMVFSLRDITGPGHDESLVDLLSAKAEAGIPVWVITDRKQSDGVDANGNRVARDDDTEDRLRAAGVHVYEATNLANQYTAMHHKVGIFGKSRIRVITDAANWTYSGLGSSTRRARNIESQLFIDSSRLDDGRTGRRYIAQWLRVASRYAAQSAGDGEPSYDQIWESLSSQADWPTQGTTFTAHDAQTQLGQNVYVRGSLSELGSWGDASEGWMLSTDEQSYPTWNSMAVDLPLGATFEWKFVISYPGGSPVWESGDNRTGFAQPSVLRDEHAIHSGAFR